SGVEGLHLRLIDSGILNLWRLRTRHATHDSEKGRRKRVQNSSAAYRRRWPDHIGRVNVESDFRTSCLRSSMSTAKQELTELIQRQPEDSSREEIIRELAFHAMVERGLADSDSQRVLSNEEMARRIRLWRK